MWNTLLDEAGASRPEVPRLPDGVDYERSPDGLAGILREAGMAVTRAGTHAWRWRVGADDLWTGLTSIGSFGVLWRGQPDTVQARVRDAYDAISSEGFAFDVECVVVEARVPRS
jgi:hypothetical protein